MRRALSFVLGLLMLLSILTLGTGTVSAVTVESVDFTTLISGSEFSSSVTGGTWYDSTNFELISSLDATINIYHDDIVNAGVLEATLGGSTTYVRFLFKEQLPLPENATVKITYSTTTVGQAYAIGFLVVTDTGAYQVNYYTYVGSATVENAILLPAPYDYPAYSVADGLTVGSGITAEFNPIQVLRDNGVQIDYSDVRYIQVYFGLRGYSTTMKFWLYNLTIEAPGATVTFNLKDALTGQSLTDVTVKEGDTVLSTIDDGQSLELTKGTHTLTFEKTGYWSTSITIDVQSDMSLSVEMYPDSAAFQFLNFPSDIQVYENSIYELTFTLSPISTQATYNTYLSLSGLSDVLEVRKDGQLVSPESGKYYLGDISGDTQITIKFKAGSVGTHSLTITLTSNDAIMSQTYTTSKQVVYEVQPLPFFIQMPSEWTVGTNEVRISESSGQSLVITAVLKDSQGNEVWSDSHAFSPYEAYTFQVNVPAEGSYTLEFQFLSTVAVFDVQVNPAITLLTDTITAKEGDIGTVQVRIKNPSSTMTKYYTIVLEGPIIEGNVSKSVSVAPLSEKTVDLAFQVPNDLTYDAYDLTLKVLEGDSVQFQDTVHLVIDSGGFSLPAIGGESSSWLWIIGGLLVLGVGIWALRRR
ncbi:MAG: hypothetical protein H0Z18_07995 [Thermococcus sp.]|uniref:hypothetical protein n=1 Tax=Thermococcus sp. TaxID=35749 RepID=UPI001DCF548A|nr:hypothetical protein [Thermococcus sp.]MBO8175184.1 hypothetical protein [Thermococcus sp.]